MLGNGEQNDGQNRDSHKARQFAASSPQQTAAAKAFRLRPPAICITKTKVRETATIASCHGP
jgi:hypothetical protein